MSVIKLILPDGLWPSIQRHLLPERGKVEEAAFLFAAVEEEPSLTNLRVIDWYPVPPEGFEEQSPYFLHVGDETKAHVIKRAHDLQAALIEVHSHPFQTIAEFSQSDLLGFSEFVPHVRWRLKRRPYAAVVVADRTFDALAWAGDSKDAGPLHSIDADGEHFYPTGATEPDSGESYGTRRPVQPK